jgi:hypothetical protein
MVYVWPLSPSSFEVVIVVVITNWVDKKTLATVS